MSVFLVSVFRVALLLLLAWVVSGGGLEYTTPGGILSTNCHRGCTEVAVHESNCSPPCSKERYERCVLSPRHPEPECPSTPSGSSPSLSSRNRRSYVCRCFPCLYRAPNDICVPSCNQDAAHRN